MSDFENNQIPNQPEQNPNPQQQPEQNVNQQQYGNGQPQPPYNQFPSYYYQQPQPKKSNKFAISAIIFTCVLVLLFLVFIMGFFIRGFFLNSTAGTTTSMAPLFPTSSNVVDDTSSSATSSKKEIIENTNAPELKIEETYSDEILTSRDIAKKVLPSVVGVIVYTEENGVEKVISEGSGIVMTKDGYIITNSHVVDDTDSNKVKIVTYDNSIYLGKVVGFDTRTDLAIIKVTATNLIPAQFANSNDLEIGEPAYVIGNPGGLDYSSSMTQGIISGLNRIVGGISSSMELIQIDAAVNPGNSGGALINEHGMVVGVVSAKVVKEHFEGIGFAIPITDAKLIIDQICRYTTVVNDVKIGITGTDVTESMAAYYKCPTGVLIVTLEEGSSIGNTKVVVGDIITHFDDAKISSISDIYIQLKKHKVGDKVNLKVFHWLDKECTQSEVFEVEVTLNSSIS